jgi:hypothetical protein
MKPSTILHIKVSVISKALHFKLNLTAYGITQISHNHQSIKILTFHLLRINNHYTCMRRLPHPEVLTIETSILIILHQHDQ